MQYATKRLFTAARPKLTATHSTLAVLKWTLSKGTSEITQTLHSKCCPTQKFNQDLQDVSNRTVHRTLTQTGWHDACNQFLL